MTSSTRNALGSLLRSFSAPAFGTALVVALLLPAPADLGAQEPGIKIASGDFGLGIGDVPRLDGLRINFRDDHLERVRGLNVTVWSPVGDPAGRGRVRGVALGLPLTGAGDLEGVGLGVGVSVERGFQGVGLGLLGAGAGGDATGLFVGGLGAGTGGDFLGVGVGGLGIGAGGDARGILAGGLGVGAGGDIEGILVGGLGAGASGGVRGLAVGGLGVGAGGDATGVLVGGLGVGASGDATGLLVGGLGVGAAGDVTGVLVGGLGAGVGGHLKGLAVGGMGVGASRITGVVLTGLWAGGEDVNAFVMAPAYFRIPEEGRFQGVSVSAFNHVEGRQDGLTIGIVNLARDLHGVQVGLVNIALNKESYRVLPLVNWAP